MHNRWWHKGLLAGLLFAMLMASCGRAAEPTPTSTPTALPTITPCPTATLTATLAPSVLSSVAPGAELLALLTPLQPHEVSIHRNRFAQANPSATLLVPMESLAEQIALLFTDQNGQTWILGNFNLPVFGEGQVEFQPVFNTPDFVFLMGWVDNEGNWLYHIPLMPGQEGKAPLVYQKGGQIYEALVDLTTNQIDPASEKLYWQEMPEKAVKAVMAKYGDAVYVTFWDKEGNQLEEARIKVFDLPPHPTPTPTRPKPTPTPEIPKQPDLIWEGQPAPLGIVIPEYWDTPDASTTLISGKLKRVYRETITFMGSEQAVWMISVDFGVHAGKPVICQFLLGRDTDIAVEVRLPGREYTGGIHGLHDKPVSVRELIKDLQIGRQYAFWMYVSIDLSKAPANCNDLPLCVFTKEVNPYIERYNTLVYKILNGQAVVLDPDSFGYMRTIVKPNWKN